MSPQPSQIAHYTITAKLGEGGMGAVYRATDTKLHREVAIKILPDALAADPDYLARFTREAQVLAALNHPHIAAVYGVEDRAIVMELVEGRELPLGLPLDEALPIVHQLIDALEYAHERGIVHRDLKPANIKLTPDGRVKVLDFGLAKAMSRDAAPRDPQSSPTVTLRATMAGVIMGTAGYMAPEQARGQDVDKRADIWAFGAVVYELVTGQRLFDGATISDSLAAVLTREPDFDRAPPQLRKLLRLCLVRDVRQRLRDIGDARIAIADGAAAPPSKPVASPSRLPWILAAVFCLSSLIFAALWSRRPAEEAHTVRFTVPPPDKSSFYDAIPSISPDGRRIVFGSSPGGTPQLWVRDLDANAARPLPGTDGAVQPFWAPDSRRLGFFANGKLKKIDISGGPASTIADIVSSRGGAWNAGDVIVFNGNNIKPLLRVDASGGTPAPVTAFDASRGETGHLWPFFLPDGRHFLYTARSSDPEKTAIWVGDLESNARRMVLAAASNAVYDPRGLILFMRGNTLMAQPFDAKRLATAGDAFTAAEQVDYTVSNLLGHFAISRTGALAYYSGGSGAVRQLTWFDRAGKPVGTVGQPGAMAMFALSPDGGKVAIDRMDAQTGFFNIWLHDLAHDTSSRFTSVSSRYPAWSPDGSRLVFLSDRTGKIGLYLKAIGGTGQEELLFESPMAIGTSWSRDGKFVFVTRVSEKTRRDIWVVPNPLDPAARKPFAFLQTEADEGLGADLSPDGRYLAYSSNENGSYQVYVQSFPGKEDKFQISAGGGLRPLWSRDGRELFYHTPGGKLMAVDVRTGPRFEHGVPKPLLDLPMNAVASRFDVSPDGKRFLAPISVGDSGNVSLRVVLNWLPGVKK